MKMNLKTRIDRLEAALRPGQPEPPFWSDDEDAGGFEYQGEFLAWEEYERRYPDAPRVLLWSDHTTRIGVVA